MTYALARVCVQYSRMRGVSNIVAFSTYTNVLERILIWKGIQYPCTVSLVKNSPDCATIHHRTIETPNIILIPIHSGIWSSARLYCIVFAFSRAGVVDGEYAADRSKYARELVVCSLTGKIIKRNVVRWCMQW